MPTYNSQQYNQTNYSLAPDTHIPTQIAPNHFRTNRWYRYKKLPAWAMKWPYTGGVGPVVTASVVATAMGNTLLEFFHGKGFVRKEKKS